MENSIKEIKKLFRTHESLSSSAINDIWNEVKREGYEYVDLSYNKTAIEEIIIPSDIPSVKYLYLYDSKIKKITLNGSLPNLEILHVGKNELKEFILPSGFPKLEHLRLDENQLETFEIMNPTALKNMQSLFLQKNKITNIEASFWDVNGNCWDNVKTVLKAIDISGAIINNEAKVIWFGNGMAGKTTLSAQIRNKIFPDIKEEDRTHGILIENWKIPYQKDAPDFKELTQVIHQEIQEEKEKKPDMEIPLPENIILSMWDFGGQEYYHATHRLFLNNNVMYLLVWDEDTETQNEEKGIYPRAYWRDNIRYYADKEKVILEIQNKVKGRAAVNHGNDQYKIDFRSEKDARSIQKYEWDVEDLEKGIISRLHQLGFLGRIFPKAYDDIRIALRNHKSKYLSYTAYRQFCQENDPTRDTEEPLMIDEKQVENLTTFLDNTGAIICYRNKKNCPKGLEDLVFLDSAWVTDMIYKILNKELILKGEFDKKHVAEQTENSGLSAEQWINLMKQFRLIFEIEKEKDEVLKTYYVAPQYLPKKCLNIAAKRMTLKGKKMLPAFSLHFPKFLAKSIFLEFLANFGSASEMYLYWKTGIVFFVSDTLVVADCDYKNKKINFKIQNGNTQVLNELFHWFEKEEKINDDTEVKLNDEDGFINIKQLKENLGNNIQKFIHKDCTISCADYELLLMDRMGEEGMKMRGIGFDKLPAKKRKSPREEENNPSPNNPQKTNQMIDIYEYCNTLISKGNLEKAVDLLNDCLKKTSHTSLYNSMILQSGRLSESNRRINEGVSSFKEEGILRSQVRIALFSIMKDMKEEGIREEVLAVNEPKKEIFDTQKKRNILFLGVNPKNTERLRIDEELREIELEFIKSIKRDNFEMTAKGAVTSRDFQHYFMNNNPQIIHFSGHGEQEGIIVEDKNGNGVVITDVALDSLFSMYDNVECVVLNACYTLEQAELIAKYVPYVIGIDSRIPDKTSISFSIGFYMALGAGRDYEFAYKSGRTNIRMEHPEAIVLPVLIKGRKH